jgi:hypothetical protein
MSLTCIHADGGKSVNSYITRFSVWVRGSLGRNEIIGIPRAEAGHAYNELAPSAPIPCIISCPPRPFPIRWGEASR